MSPDPVGGRHNMVFSEIGHQKSDPKDGHHYTIHETLLWHKNQVNKFSVMYDVGMEPLLPRYKPVKLWILKNLAK